MCGIAPLQYVVLGFFHLIVTVFAGLCYVITCHRTPLYFAAAAPTGHGCECGLPAFCVCVSTPFLRDVHSDHSLFLNIKILKSIKLNCINAGGLSRPAKLHLTKLSAVSRGYH